MCFSIYTNFEFMYLKISRLAIRPESLKKETSGVVSKSINFGCWVLMSVWPHVTYLPVLVRATIVFCAISKRFKLVHCQIFYLRILYIIHCNRKIDKNWHIRGSYKVFPPSISVQCVALSSQAIPDLRCIRFVFTRTSAA